MKRNIFWLPVVLVALLMLSCERNEEINIYTGSSQLWVRIAPSSLGLIKNLEITFVDKDVKSFQERYLVSFSNKRWNPELGIMDGSWIKIHESFSESDLIFVIFKGKTYKTRGYSFGEKRFVEIELKCPSVKGGYINTTDYNIEMIERNIYVE